MNKKILIGSIIAVAILLLPSAVAMPELSSTSIDKTELQNTGSSGKPDLIIEGIATKPENWYEDEYLCRIKNIGNETTYDFIDLEVTIKRLFLGKFPIKTVRFYRSSGKISSGVSPGETYDLFFAYESNLPIFGFYRFDCVVNPQHTIDESDYNNNFYSKTYFVIFRYD